MSRQNIRFVCQPGCRACCDQRGFVYFTQEDVGRVAEFLGLTAAEFERRYIYRTRHLRRLRNTRRARCQFLTADGCAIHQVKPTQCRAFPFWPEILEDGDEWRKTKALCPGLGKGELVTIQIARERAEEMRAAYPSLY